MAEIFIGEVEEFLRKRQQTTKAAIDELHLLRKFGNKLIAEEKDALVASIVAAIDVQSEMEDRNLFAGNREPEE